MAINKKEFKGMWENRTLGELKGYYSELIIVSEKCKKLIKQEATKIIELDVVNKHYVSRLKEYTDSIKGYTKTLEDNKIRLEIIKPMLDKKEAEGINQAEYEKYMKDNIVNIKPLIETVREKERKFIENGCKILVPISKDEIKTIVISEKEAHEIHEQLLKETIWIIKDQVGNIEKVYNLKYNDKRGFDCSVKGDKGSLNINTILAGGYNVQQLHYRTLVHKF